MAVSDGPPRQGYRAAAPSNNARHEVTERVHGEESAPEEGWDLERFREGNEDMEPSHEENGGSLLDAAEDDDDGSDDDVETIDHESDDAEQGPADAEEEIEEPPPPRRSPEVNSVQDLIATLPNWARQNADLLRSHLTGIVALVTTDPSRSYRIDWSGERLVVEAGDNPNADCRVVLSQGDLMRVVRGDLNPQIAMLSGRIRATGNPEMAMYLFNLIVRR